MWILALVSFITISSYDSALLMLDSQLTKLLPRINDIVAPQKATDKSPNIYVQFDEDLTALADVNKEILNLLEIQAQLVNINLKTSAENTNKDILVYVTSSPTDRWAEFLSALDVLKFKKFKNVFLIVGRYAKNAQMLAPVAKNEDLPQVTPYMVVYFEDPLGGKVSLDKTDTAGQLINLKSAEDIVRKIKDIIK